MHMAIRKTAQIRLNDELKKAVHSGSGWYDYKVTVQFLNSMKDLLRNNIQSARAELSLFFGGGGVIEEDDSGDVFDLSFDGVNVHIVYDGGEVSEYTVSGMKGRRDVVQRLLSLFFYDRMLPKYENMVVEIDRMLADLDNDTTLRGLSELREIIRGDRYMTVSAISGLPIRDESDDGYDLFGGEEE